MEPKAWPNHFLGLILDKLSIKEGQNVLTQKSLYIGKADMKADNMMINLHCSSYASSLFLVEA